MWLTKRTLANQDPKKNTGVPTSAKPLPFMSGSKELKKCSYWSLAPHPENPERSIHCGTSRTVKVLLWKSWPKSCVVIWYHKLSVAVAGGCCEFHLFSLPVRKLKSNILRRFEMPRLISIMPSSSWKYTSNYLCPIASTLFPSNL